MVEDNPDHETLTLRALKKAGLADPVVVARDGAEALDYLFGKGRYRGCVIPKAVLLDLKLPKVDGLEVLQKMRADQRTESIPVVVLTSSEEESDLVSSYKYGANSYIRKPVDFLQFVEATRPLGLYWQLVNDKPTVK